MFKRHILQLDMLDVNTTQMGNKHINNRAELGRRPHRRSVAELVPRYVDEAAA